MKEEKKGRCYISGKIADEGNYVPQFIQGAAYVRKELNMVPVNPVFLSDVMSPDDGFTQEEYMNICMRLLEMCDAIAMLPGWDKSFGAVAEWGFALGKNLEIFEIPDEVIVQEDAVQTYEIPEKENMKPYEVGTPEAAAAIERVKMAEKKRETTGKKTTIVKTRKAT